MDYVEIEQFRHMAEVAFMGPAGGPVLMINKHSKAARYAVYVARLNEMHLSVVGNRHFERKVVRLARKLLTNRPT